MRDRIVGRVANWFIRTFASDWYVENLRYTFALGMAVREQKGDEECRW